MQAAELVQAALRARDHAYAPYSGYSVGAAVLAEDGRVFTGANVENASYGLTLCAERVAIAAAAAAGVRKLAALAVVTRDGASPCGACRQFAEEFALHLPIHLASEDGTFTTCDLAELLPRAFNRRSL